MADGSISKARGWLVMFSPFPLGAHSAGRTSHRRQTFPILQPLSPHASGDTMAMGNLSSEATLEQQSCRQCGDGAPELIGRLSDSRSFAGQVLADAWPGGHLYRCQKCALVFRAPIAPESTYESLYSSATDTVWQNVRSRGDHGIIMRLVSSHCKDAADVLDLGCYDGSLLASLPPRLRMFGVEASVAASEVARGRGIDMIAGNMRGLDQIDRQFDAVMAVDVIEHMHSPANLVRQMLKLARSGGVVLVSTGDADSWAWRMAGSAYWYSAMPEHVSFVSTTWATHLARQLGVRLSAVVRFPYYDDRGPGLASRLKFCVAALKERARRQWKGPEHLRDHFPRWTLGEPGLFADHMVFVLQKT